MPRVLLSRHIFLATILIFGFNASTYADASISFSKAKRIAPKLIYHDHQTTFYCGCDYQRIGKTTNIDLASCGYQPRKNENKASRVEWEHVVPAWHFGHQRQCWQKGGRKNCRKTDPIFNKMEADLHNLVPATGETNGDRSNYKFAMLEGEPRKYGQCDFEVDFKTRTTEPADAIRGDIARIYFYMRDEYQLRISSQQTKLFDAWAKLDPVDQWECEKNERVGDVQGNLNPHISQDCNPTP